jgi:hypothetical protein
MEFAGNRYLPRFKSGETAPHYDEVESTKSLKSALNCLEIARTSVRGVVTSQSVTEFFCEPSFSILPAYRVL